MAPWIPAPGSTCIAVSSAVALAAYFSDCHQEDSTNGAPVVGRALSSFSLSSVTLPRTPLCAENIVCISHVLLGWDSWNDRGRSFSWLFKLTNFFKEQFVHLHS